MLLVPIPGMVAAVAAPPFSPASLSLDAWYEVVGGSGSLAGSTSGSYTGALDDEAAIAAAGMVGTTQVSQWDDLSGNGRHLMQATAGDRPAWITDAASDFQAPSLNFGGGGPRLERAASGISFASGGFVAFRFTTDTVASGGYGIVASRVSATNRFSCRIHTNNLRAGFDNGAAVGAASGNILASTKYTVQWHFTGSTGTLYVNGVAQGGALAPVQGNADGALWVGAIPGESSNSLDGRLVALLIRAGALPSASERDQIDTYLSERYA